MMVIFIRKYGSLNMLSVFLQTNLLRCRALTFLVDSFLETNIVHES